MKHDNTTGSLYLWHLVYVRSLKIVFDPVRTRMHLYAIVICTDGTITNMCLCFLLVAICVVCHCPGVFYYLDWSVLIFCNYGCIFVIVHVLAISIHPPLYSIARCNFFVTVLCLSDDTVFLIVSECHWSTAVFICSSCARC